MASKKYKEPKKKRAAVNESVRFAKTAHARIEEVVKGLPASQITSPAVRARSLAAHLTNMAEFLSLPMEGIAAPLANAIKAQLAETSGLNEAWRAIRHLTKERHQRLALIECISTVSRRYKLNATMPLKGQKQVGLREAAELVRDFYMMSFPQFATKLNLDKVEIAVIAWGNKSGRRKRGGPPPKWKAINDVAIDVGIAYISPLSISREWWKYGGELNRGT